MVAYSPDEFNALVAEVERQGGAHLPDLCIGTEIRYKVGRNPPTKVKTCHCGHDTMFVTVYESEGEERTRGGGFARVCAVCDDVGLWPRFFEPVFGETDEEGDD